MADFIRLNALLGLTEALECRRKTLLAYFCDENMIYCQCDLCSNSPKTYDGTTTVRKALSAVLRTEQHFGTVHLIQLLTGKETDKICAFSHQNLPTFGIGQELSRQAWQSVFLQMMGHDLLRPDVTRHGALCITKNALPILQDQDRITLREKSE